MFVKPCMSGESVVCGGMRKFGSQMGVIVWLSLMMYVRMDGKLGQQRVWYGFFVVRVDGHSV